MTIVVERGFRDQNLDYLLLVDKAVKVFLDLVELVREHSVVVIAEINLIVADINYLNTNAKNEIDVVNGIRMIHMDDVVIID